MLHLIMSTKKFNAYFFIQLENKTQWTTIATTLIVATIITTKILATATAIVINSNKIYRRL